MFLTDKTWILPILLNPICIIRWMRKRVSIFKTLFISELPGRMRSCNRTGIYFLLRTSVYLRSSIMTETSGCENRSVKISVSVQACRIKATIGRLAVIEINGQKYLVESVYTTLNYRDYFKPVFLIAGIVLLIFSVGIPCLTAIRPYSQYKKAYENNRFKNNLIDSLAHNLKTPLQILGGYAENLKDVSDAAEKDHYADQILAKTQEMNADIESILKAADKTSIILTRTSARKIFEEAAKKAGTDIDIKGDREIKADRDYFLSAAFNLIDNAAKYKTGDSGIEVSILPKDITVRNRTDKDKFTPGTGLAIAGRIIEQHGLRLMTDLKDGVFEARITKK